MHPEEPSTDLTADRPSVEQILCEMYSSPEPLPIPDVPPSNPQEPNPEANDGKEQPVKYSTGPTPDEPPNKVLPSEEHSLTGTLSNPDQKSSTLSEPNLLRCEFHGKELGQFCMTCATLICKDCSWSDGTHKRHEIDSVEAVYRERRVLTEQKVVQLDNLTKSLQNDVQSNMQMLQDQERSVYKQIDSICAKEKQNVSRQVNERKRSLQMPLEFLNKKQKLVESLQLSPAEFLKQLLQIDKQLDEMLAENYDFCNFFEHFNDIGCELVPPFDMRTFELDHFETVDKWPKDIVTVCGNSWTVHFHKKDSLFVKVTPHSKELLNFPLQLRVVVTHRELQKTIKKAYILQKTLAEIEIVTIEQLRTEGFIQNSALIVKIGLRPLNALVANHLLKQQLETMRKNSQFYVMYFSMNVKLTNLKEFIHSTCLIDSAERKWCLAVNPFEKTVGHNPWGDLQAFIILWNGPGTRCRYFIELLHNDPEKSLRRYAESKFENKYNKKGSKIRAQGGWPCFLQQHRLLSDPGFYSEGILRFRFGVSPITE